MANPVNFPEHPAVRLEGVVWLIAQDVTGNASRIGWQLWIKKNSASSRFSSNPGQTWVFNLNGIQMGAGSFTYNFNNYDNLLLAEGTSWFSHNSSGELTLNMNAGATGDGLGYANATGVIPLPTIARASRASFSEVAGPAITAFDAGHQITIHTNRASSSLTHTLIVSFANGAVYETIATGVGATFNWTPPMSMLDAIPNATSGVGFIRTLTYSGATLLGQYDSVFTLRAGASVKPTIPTVTVTDDNATVSSQVGALVQGLSLVKGVVNATPAYSSPITSSQFTVNGITKPSGESSVVTASGTVPITAQATDTRGRVGTFAGNITVLPYAEPAITALDVRRANSGGTVTDSGTYLRVDLTAAVQSLVNGTQKNTLGIRVFTRVRGTTPWTARNVINHGSLTYASNFLVSGGAAFPVNQTFDVRVEVFDKFDLDSQERIVGTEAVHLDFQASGIGVRRRWQQGALDVTGQIYQNDLPVLDTGDVASETVAGIAERATNAEALTGTDSTRYVSPANVKHVLDNRPQSAFAEAAGTVWCPATGVTTVTFPSGRFSQPPRVVATVIGNANVAVVHVGYPTTTSVAVRVFTIGGAQYAAQVDWHAVQMTSADSSG